MKYLHGDALGSVSLTTSDATPGAKLSELRYTSFGEVRYQGGQTATDKRFTGQRQEAGIGLYDYGARMYSPFLGRFISPDSVVPGAGNPQAFNRYSYVLNNPLSLVDPTGHIPCGTIKAPGNTSTSPTSGECAFGWNLSDIEGYAYYKKSNNILGKIRSLFGGDTDDVNGCACRNVLYPVANMLAAIHGKKGPSYVESFGFLARYRSAAGFGFTSSDGLAKGFNAWAKSAGLTERATNRTAKDFASGLTDIKAQIDKGNPVAILWSTDGSGSIDTQHWVLAVGYNGSEISILDDTNRKPGSSTSNIYQYKVTEFEQNWGKGIIPTINPKPFNYVTFS